MGYRRFIAYVYEYRKGKKEDNCGFVKVEVRNHMCTIEPHLQVGNLAAGEVCKVYGFVRKEGLMNGILLGSCKTEANRIECLVETDGMDMGGSGIPLEKMGGMILLTESGGFFGTEWDDQPIRPENFRAVDKPVEKQLPDEEKQRSDESQNSNQNNDQNEENPVENEQKTDPSEQPVSSYQKELHAQSLEAQPEILPGTPWDAFSDGELTDCRKITPDELHCMGRRFCMLKNNRFLQYGYYNFGHLLLCRNRRGQYILGVPGGYDQQERFMAGMFGFPYFKESSQISLPGRKGGYWYRSVDSPNFH